MFRKSPEEVQLIQLFQTTRVSETRRWSGQRYMVVNTRVAGPWNLIAEIITIPLQIIAAIPLVGLPALLILWLFGFLWVLLSHVITLPAFVVASLLIGETSASSRRHSSKHEVAEAARGTRRTLRRRAMNADGSGLRQVTDLSAMSTEIVQRQTPEEEELARKLAELAALETELAERELDLATLVSELHLFERRYLHVVGARYAKLDELRALIAEARARQTPHDTQARQDAAQARHRAQESAQAAGAADAHAPEARFRPSENLKSLFREVARRVHPDLATDEQERARRTRLMAEANSAYEEGDEARLQAILQEWESSPEAVKGEGPGAELVRVIRKIAQVRARLNAIEVEMTRLKGSPLCALKAKVEEVEAEGRDLLAEMTAALDRQIANAREELARIAQEPAEV